MDRNISQKPWIFRFFARIYRGIRAYFAFLGIVVTLLGIGWGILIYRMMNQEELSVDGAPVEFDETHPLRLKLVINGKITDRKSVV